MSKIYGYKEKDVKNLCEFLRNNKSKSLTDVFRLFAKKYGKSAGTVRNLYYATAKKSREDESFRKEFTDGKIIAVKINEKFKDGEEKELVNKIIAMKSQGLSVRGAVNMLSGGDEKLALRYQNKYRNIISVKRKEKYGGAASLLKKIYAPIYPDNEIHEENLAALKREINRLYDRLIDKLKRENEYLKKRVAALEYGQSVSDQSDTGALGYFKNDGDENMVN